MPAEGNQDARTAGRTPDGLGELMGQFSFSFSFDLEFLDGLVTVAFCAFCVVLWTFVFRIDEPAGIVVSGGVASGSTLIALRALLLAEHIEVRDHGLIIRRCILSLTVGEDLVPWSAIRGLEMRVPRSFALRLWHLGRVLGYSVVVRRGAGWGSGIGLGVPSGLAERLLDCVEEVTGPDLVRRPGALESSRQGKLGESSPTTNDSEA